MPFYRLLKTVYLCLMGTEWVPEFTHKERAASAALIFGVRRDYFISMFHQQPDRVFDTVLSSFFWVSFIICLEIEGIH